MTFICLHLLMTNIFLFLYIIYISYKAFHLAHLISDWILLSIVTIAEMHVALPFSPHHPACNSSDTVVLEVDVFEWLTSCQLYRT